MPRKFATGFRQKPDERDAQFQLSKLMGAEKSRPVSKVWKAAVVTDQGSESSCVGHSCWKLIGSEPVVRNATITPSRIYVEAKKIDEWQGEDYDGTSVRAGLSILKREGYISGFYWAESAEQCLEYLLKFGPLVLGIRWTDSMFTPDATGLIRPKGSGGGGHAVMAYAGHWKKRTITIRGSWSEEWGKKGDCIMLLQDLDILLKEGGVAAAVTEELV